MTALLVVLGSSCVNGPAASVQENHYTRLSAVEARETPGMIKAVLLIRSELAPVHHKEIRRVARATLGPRFIPARYADHLIESSTGIVNGGHIMLEAWRYHGAEVLRRIPEDQFDDSYNLPAVLNVPMRLDPKMRFRPTAEIVAELKEQNAARNFSVKDKELDMEAIRLPTAEGETHLSWMSMAFGRVLRGNSISHFLVLLTDLNEEQYQQKRFFSIRSLFVNPESGKWRFLTLSKLTRGPLSPGFDDFFAEAIRDHFNKINIELR